MQKKKLYKKLIKAMKITIAQMLLAICFISIGYAHTAEAQSDLNQKIYLQAQDESLSKVLKQIEKQTKIRCVFSSKLIQSNQKVNVTFSGDPLSTVLDNLLKPRLLQYKVVDKVIILKKVEDSKTFITPTLEPIHIEKVEIVPSFVITGVVSNEKGEPLVGSAVVLEGTQKGTLTDENGSYKLELDEADKKGHLIFSFVGFEKQTVAIDGRSIINITMKEATELNEVIVVGYGEQKKPTITGAVERISSKTLESRAVTNIGLALQGQTPGLLVTRNSPRPGNEGVKLQIRGETSINGGSPLVLIDGVEAVESNAWLNMNPDDIDNISVLKDASAAIYGSRAANGVILVTTKRGVGKLKFEYSNNLRFTTNGITGYSPSLQEYAKLWVSANKEEPTPWWWVWGDNSQKIDSLANGYEGVMAFNNYGWTFVANANRLDELFARRYSHQHNFSLSNRTDIAGYRLSFAYADNQGNLATAYDGQKQFNLRFNYDYKISDRIKFETGLSAQNTNTATPTAGLDATLYANDMPFFPAKNPLGQWYANFGTIGNRNSAAATSDGGRTTLNKLMGRLDMKGTINIFDGLSAEVLSAFQYMQNKNERYLIPVQLYDWFGNKAVEQLSATIQSAGNPGYSLATNSNFYQYYSSFLKYNKTLGGNHTLSLAAGIQAEKYQIKSLNAARVYFANQGIYDLNVADPTVQTTSGGKTQEGFYAYIARANYNYKEKYLFEVLGRRDGSSRFAPGYKYKNYGGGSVGWVYSKEDFMPNWEWLTLGKVRASYGGSGNYAGISYFDYLSAINLGTVPLGNPVALQTSSGLANNGLISKERTWEQVYQKNIGIDLSFFRNRLTASFDYFQKENKGMLVNVSYPAVLGGSAPKTNNGHLTTTGWESFVGWRDQIKDFGYNFSINMSNTNNILNSMEGATTYGPGKNGTVVGYPLNSWFLYQTNGYFSSKAEVDAYYASFKNNAGLLASVQGDNILRAGDTKVIDYNGDGIISNVFDPKADNGKAADYKFMGDAAPHYIFGVNMGANWKGFDISGFFQGVGQQYIVRQGWLAYPFATIYTNQPISFVGKTWTESNPDAEFPRLTLRQNRANWNYQNKDFMMQNNRYIRLKSLIIGYTLPKTVLKKLKIDRVRVYFSGNDLWELTSIKDGYDPEQGETTQNSGYPFYRTWSFGVNVGF